MKHTVAQLAYLAGIIDGEGCLFINKRKDKRHLDRDHNFNYSCGITVVSTNEKMILWLANTFGGHAHLLSPPKGNRKQSWQWRADATLAYSLVKQIQPYMIIKEPHTHIFLKFSESVIKTRDYHGRWDRITPENLSIKQQCYLAIKELNHRGR